VPPPLLFEGVAEFDAAEFAAVFSAGLLVHAVNANNKQMLNAQRARVRIISASKTKILEVKTLSEVGPPCKQSGVPFTRKHYAFCSLKRSRGEAEFSCGWGLTDGGGLAASELALVVSRNFFESSNGRPSDGL
jgi:hypothetical protein